MQKYSLVFVFDKNGRYTLVRTMPDGHNKGLLNGLGGRSNVATMRDFFDDIGSCLIGNVQVMDVILKSGCTPSSDKEPIILHVEGRVYNELKLDDKSPKAEQIQKMESYDALMRSIETEENEFVTWGRDSRVYVRGYHYFFEETYDAILHMKKKTGQFPDFYPYIGYANGT